MSLASLPVSTDPVLRVENVAKSYGTLKALDDVSLTLKAGEFVALLGLNGAGKSTLFQLLSGLFAADAGQIVISGHDISQSAIPALAGMGIVFQQPTLDLSMSVYANLIFHARLHGMGSATKPRIQAELNRLGLSEQTKTTCIKLSGGNRRKVELARALLHEPRLLLMDEATVGLDPASRKGLVDYVHQLCRERGMGVLWATHLVDEVEDVERVIILHKGKVLATGTPADLLQQTGKIRLADAFLELTATPKSS
ncbi:ABC transporter ATP-binding protein [Beggiatoa leptomitoformis]|uniref:ATP-binding cassette domain-containing protein n=1 Tax=Beggiatoa leptomitoformis TaxID=288004 RepID=A0A2N9YAU3_9GAMM|nr:ABC transporter ATP-binding protein [Beggiatoa leptomitoformis]ALG67048.1 ATP-binding cassette domain-containing protein [Beggiatoa leptomitoformis]AUI67571.1 ATP-binding cassette domain-containing protein [Beggiatoa leptomitoformis]